MMYHKQGGHNPNQQQAIIPFEQFIYSNNVL